jgi:hypothetical protein
MGFWFLLIAFVMVSFFTFYMLFYLKDMLISKKLFDENPNLDFIRDNGVAINEEGEVISQTKPVTLS